MSHNKFSSPIRTGIRQAIGGMAVLGAVLLSAGPAAADAGKVTALIDRVSGGFAALQTQTGLSPEERVAKLESLFQETFDVEKISKLVIAEGETSPTPAQLSEFRFLFGRYVAMLCAGWLSGFSGQDLVVSDGTVPADGQGLIKAEIRREAPEEPIRVDFRVRDTGEGYRIYDVLVEGISLVMTKRDEIRSLIRREGMDRMLARLRDVTQMAEAGATSARR